MKFCEVLPYIINGNVVQIKNCSLKFNYPD